MSGRPMEKSDKAGLKFMKKTRKKRVIVLEDLDFVWDEPDLNELSNMWADNKSLHEMADRFEREIDEIVLGLLHLAREGKITNRNGGLLHGLI